MIDAKTRDKLVGVRKNIEKQVSNGAESQTYLNGFKDCCRISLTHGVRQFDDNGYILINGQPMKLVPLEKDLI